MPLFGRGLYAYQVKKNMENKEDEFDVNRPGLVLLQEGEKYDIIPKQTESTVSGSDKCLTDSQ